MFLNTVGKIKPEIGNTISDGDDKSSNFKLFILLSFQRWLSFRDAHIASHNLQTLRPDQQCRRVLDPPYDEMVAAHLK